MLLLLTPRWSRQLLESGVLVVLVALVLHPRAVLVARRVDLVWKMSSSMGFVATGIVRYCGWCFV